MDKITEIYEGMLQKASDEIVTESEGTDKTPKAPGINKSFDGSDKNGKPIKAEKVAGVPTPTEATPAPEGKPQKLGKKEINDSVALSFDQLFKKVIKEDNELGDEENDEVVKSPSIEGDEFDTDKGDFGEGEEGADETEEEIDLATELRMLAGRMNEIADKLSSGDEDLEDLEGDEGMEEVSSEEALGGMGEGTGGEPNPAPVRESMQNQMKPAKKTSLNPKMKQNPKASGYTSKSGAGTAQKPAQKQRDGTLSPLGAEKGKSLQNGMTVKGKGPAHKGGNDTYVK